MVDERDCGGGISEDTFHLQGVVAPRGIVTFREKHEVILEFIDMLEQEIISVSRVVTCSVCFVYLLLPDQRCRRGTNFVGKGRRRMISEDRVGDRGSERRLVLVVWNNNNATPSPQHTTF